MTALLALLTGGFLAGCVGTAPAGPAINTRMENPSVKPTDERKDLPEDVLHGTNGGFMGDKVPWPRGGWAQVTASAKLPARTIPRTEIVLAFVVRSNGTVTDVAVLSGGPPDVAEAMAAALCATPFEPGIRDGHAVNVRMQQTMIIERK